MADASNKIKETEKILKEVIDVLHDGQQGFAHIGEHIEDDQLKRYFLAESLKRATFRGELENELYRDGVKDLSGEGTVKGALHRTWGELKAKFGVSDHELLETAEQGEDEAKKVYEDALSQDLPMPIRQLLVEQQTHILSSHDYVKSHRDMLVAK